jgi:hypothetical protein
MSLQLLYLPPPQSMAGKPAPSLYNMRGKKHPNSRAATFFCPLYKGGRGLFLKTAGGGSTSSCPLLRQRRGGQCSDFYVNRSCGGRRGRRGLCLGVRVAQVSSLFESRSQETESRRQNPGDRIQESVHPERVLRLRTNNRISHSGRVEGETESRSQNPGVSTPRASPSTPHE